MAYLRNPLAWYKRYVEGVRDMPSTPASIVGRAGHVALEHYYSGTDKDTAVRLGADYLERVPDFEIAFGKHETRGAQKKKRLSMLKDYHQAIGFYLARPPRYKKILGVEVVAMARVPGVPLPVKAVSDLVVASSAVPGGVDIVDHKFVDHFTGVGADKPLFIIQALFNYYTVKAEFKKEPIRFILQECKKRENRDGRGQMRRYVIDYRDCEEEFKVFERLLKDASAQIVGKRTYLPNPSDMFEGSNSFDIYRLDIL